MGWIDAMERADEAYHSYPDLTERFPCCKDGDIWFDRTLCPKPCGSMHDRCDACGRAVDGCAIEDAIELQHLAV
jgi:hypothetical protein